MPPSNCCADIAGFLVSLLAMLWSKKKPTARLSYGYHRAEILGALLSLSFVWFITGLLVAEAIERLRNPVPINGKLMMLVAALGIVANIIMGLVLHGNHHKTPLHVEDCLEEDLLISHQAHEHSGPRHNHSHHPQHHGDLNIRAALLHVLGDLLQSVGVFIGATLIFFNEQFLIADPICTLLFAGLVLGSTAYLLTDIVNVLMEATPHHIDPEKVANSLLEANSGRISEVRDIHVWSLAPGKVAATAHLVVRDASDTTVLGRCQTILKAQHGIGHSTIQIETASAT